MIISTACGKKFLQTSLLSWNKYLDLVSPNRTKIFENPFYNEFCGFKDKRINACPTCNKNIGNWNESCVKTITSENVLKYKDFFKPIKEKNEIEVNVEIYKISSTL